MKIKFFLAFVVLLLVEIIIAIFVKDKFIRPFVGDVLVIFLMYFFVKIFFSRKNILIPIFIIIFAFFVEILQFFNVVSLLKLENNIFLKTVIGTTFDTMDLICYFIGFIIIFLIEKFGL